MNIMQIIIAKIDVPETLFLNVVVRDANVDNVTALTMNSLEKNLSKADTNRRISIFYALEFLNCSEFVVFSASR